jgi:hypothetical protein
MCLLLVGVFVGIFILTRNPTKPRQEVSNEETEDEIASAPEKTKPLEVKSVKKTEPVKPEEKPEVEVKTKPKAPKKRPPIVMPSTPEEARKIMEERGIRKGAVIKGTWREINVVIPPPKNPPKSENTRLLTDFLKKTNSFHGETKLIDKQVTIQSNSLPEITIDPWLLDSLTQGKRPLVAGIRSTLKKAYSIRNPISEKLSLIFYSNARDPVFLILYSPTQKRHFGIQFDPVSAGKWYEKKIPLVEFIDETGARKVLGKNDKISKVYVLQGKYFKKLTLTVTELRIVKDIK